MPGRLRKPSWPRIYRRGGAPSAWFLTDAARRTLPGDAGDVADLAGNRPSAVRHGGCSWSSGDRGACLSLDGTSGYAESLVRAVAAGDFTWTCRVNPSATGLGGVYRLILAQGSVADGTWIGVWMNDGGTVSFQVGNAGGFTSARALSVGQWSDLALVYSAGSVTGYINGAPAAAGSDTAVYTGDRFELGISPSGSTSRCFPGKIDDVRVYPRALPAAEVARHVVDPFGRLRPAGPDLATLAALNGPAAAAGFKAFWMRPTPLIGSGIY